MIIYERKKKQLTIPCGLGPVVCPDVSHDLQMKTVDSSTVLQQVKPDSGYYGLSSVIVEPYTLESKAQTITLNGTYSFTPTSADGLSSVDISVNVADIPAVVQSKSVTYTENGEYTVTPDQGYEGLSSVDISVNIPPEPVVLQSKTVKSSTESQSVTYDSSYDGLSSVTVEPYTLDSKTVNSSTAQQVITSSVDGLSSVTVEPYTLDSKTVNSSTAQQVITSSKDGLSSVTVNPYTVESDSSTLTANGTYTFTPQNADALSSVTVDVSVNTGGTTDWIEEVRAGRLTDISSYSIAELAKKQYGAAGLFAFSNVTALPSIQDPVDNPDALVNILSLAGAFYNCKSIQSVDISIGNISGYSMDKCFYESGVRDVSIYVGAIATQSYYMFNECFYNCQELRNLYIQLGPDAGKAEKSMFEKMCCLVGNSSENENTSITINGLSEVGSAAFYNAFIGAHSNSGGITVNLPDNLSTIRGILVYEAFCNMFKDAHLTGKTTPSFLGKLDYIYGRNNFANAFANSDVETATLGFNTCAGYTNFENTFHGCQNLREVSFDGTFNVIGTSIFAYTFDGCNNLTSMTCTSTAGTKPFRDKADNNVAVYAPNITDITIDNVNSDVYLLWNQSVNAASVYGILSKAAGATVQEGDARKIEFYSSGLTVTDYEDGRIQTAYNAAVTDGWTINNLTILPYSNS